MKSTVFWEITSYNPVEITGVSDEYIAVIFGVEMYSKQVDSEVLLAVCFLQATYLACS
jgi:hypothetical protein